MNINERIKAFRNKAGLKQDKLAAYLGIDQSMLSKMESGERRVPVEIIEKLSILYGCSVEDFDRDDTEIKEIKFSLRSSTLTNNDLKDLAVIQEIAANSKLMEELIYKNVN